jgi:hypothetical protein
MKKFEMVMTAWKRKGDPEYFTEENPPTWLYNEKTKGSTMDNTWFWFGHVMTLEVGQSVQTDFRTIKRIE